METRWKNSLTVVVLLFLLSRDGVVYGHGFDYSNGPLGPDNWGKMFSSCSGKFQSPINIDMKDVLHVKLPPLRFEGFDEELEDAILTNNGHTVMVSPKDDDSDDVKVKGGPLKGAYVFKQMHFHWGMNDSLGSEDSINNQSFPMELHMVFWKESYGSYAKALEHKDGLTVMAFFYEITMDTNKAYKPLISALEEVKGNHSKKHMEDLPALKKLLPQDRVHYYYYQGSLTTPPCDEIVTWIDFTESIPLSPDQVNQFRRIMDQNHRPTQPVGERTIWFNVGPGELIMPYQLESSATTAPLLHKVYHILIIFFVIVLNHVN